MRRRWIEWGAGLPLGDWPCVAQVEACRRTQQVATSAGECRWCACHRLHRDSYSRRPSRDTRLGEQMSKNDHANIPADGINRRDFLQSAATTAAAFSLGSRYSLFATPSPDDVVAQIALQHDR